MPKILHCADIHLGAAERFLGAGAESRQAETLLTFEKIARVAKEQAVDLLLIAGDLFDSNRISTTLKERVFHALAELAPIKVLLVAGNHDPLTADSPYKSELPENVYVFGEESGVVTFEDLKTRVYGKSFGGVYLQGESRFAPKPSQDDYCNILLLHGDTTGEASPYNGISSDFLSGSGMDYVALGHLHAYSGVLRAGATYYAYPGCPEGQGFDETGEKGVLLGTVEKGMAQLDFVPLCRRRHECPEIDLSAVESDAEITPLILQNLRSTYGETFAENLYKIVLTGALPENITVPVEEIRARLNETVYYAKLRDETVPAVDLAALANEPTLKGIFARQFAQANDRAEDDRKELLDLALSLGLKAFSSEVFYRDDS